ncbi:MAG: hypothetical protein KJ579_03400 [Verrucomicrobia bacterium]|nr:hypothetical protein [Verrucomicrobiota bacterium]
MSRRQRPVLARASAALLILLAIEPRSAEPPPVDRLLETAATASGDAYLAARDAVVGGGTNALVELGRIAIDSSGTWQKRLVARICYERVVRGSEIAALRSYDWRTDPEYREEWVRSVTGPRSRMGPLVARRMAENGLWGYYIELTWKQTREKSNGHPQDINMDWARWCRLALAGQPEEMYLFLAMTDRIAKDERLESPEAVVLYRTVRDAKDANAVVVLVDRFEAFFGREVTGPEMFPGRHAQLFRGMFEPILASADSRHSDLLDKFAAVHPALFQLTPKLAEVRARPAPPPKAEPPFRLGTGIVRIP